MRIETASEELQRDNARQAKARFFLGAGRARGFRCGDGVSGELFGLPAILECEGPLATNAAPRALRVPAEERDRPVSMPAEAAYLARCEALIREAARELRA
jgi:hypothetical protein